MQLKKGFLAFALAGMAGVLAACGTEAPDLSFEETLEAYSAQQQPVREAVLLMAGQTGVVKTATEGTVSFDMKSSENGKMVFSSTSFSDAATQDMEGDLRLQLDVNSQEALMGTAVNVNAKLGLKTIIKDAVAYLNLSELEIKTNEALQTQIAMVTAMAEGLKGKWFSLAGLGLEDFLQNSAGQLVLGDEWMQDKIEHYTGVVKTTYNGQPAWKVDFNMDTLREDAKGILNQSFEPLMAEALSGANELDDELAQQIQADQAEMLAEMMRVIDTMQFENVEAYFVIYAKDNIKFVMKNADLVIKTEDSDLAAGFKISIQQTVDKKHYEGTLRIAPLQEEDAPLVIDYKIKEASSNKFDIDLTLKAPVELQEDFVLSLKGTLALVASKDAFTIKPDFKLSFDDIKIQLQGSYAVEKVAEHSFAAPEDAQDLSSLMGGFFGAPALDEDFALDTEFDAVE